MQHKILWKKCNKIKAKYKLEEKTVGNNSTPFDELSKEYLFSGTERGTEQKGEEGEEKS